MFRDISNRVLQLLKAHPRSAGAGGLCLLMLWAAFPSRQPHPAGIVAPRSAPATPGELVGTKHGAVTPTPNDPDKAEARRQNWVRVEPLIRGADLRSAKAVEEQVAAVEEYFDAARAKTTTFAEAIIGADGKWQATNALLEEGVNAIAKLFGEEPVFNRDSFREYATDCFHRMVIDPARLRETVSGAVGGWKSQAQQIRSELATTLSADLGDPDIAQHLTTLDTQVATTDRTTVAVDRAIDAAAEDLFVSMGKFILSWVLGDAVEGMVTNEKSTFLERQAVNYVASSGIEAAMDAAMKSAGRDPQAQLAAKINVLISYMQSQVIDGEPMAADEYDKLKGYARSHPDTRARAACSAATDILLPHANLGLRRKLEAMHRLDCRARRTELAEAILGDAGLVAEDPEGANVTPDVSAEAAIELARTVLARYGKTLP